MANQEINQVHDFHAILEEVQSNKTVMTINDISDIDNIIDLLNENHENDMDMPYRLNVLRLEGLSVDYYLYFKHDKIDELEEIKEFLEKWETTDNLKVFIHTAQNQHVSCLYAFCTAIDDSELQFYVVDSFSELAQVLNEDGILFEDIPEDLIKHIDWNTFEDILKNDGWFIVDGYAINDSNC